MRVLPTLSALLLLATPLLAQVPEAAKSVRVPFTLLPSRHMMLEVKVNGKGPFNLIFDTGAPLNLVNNKLAKEVGIGKKSSGGLFGGGLLGGMSQVEMSKLQVGDVTAEKLPAVVMDHPTVKAISDAFESEHGRIDGIVGFPFFGRYSTTVDYQKKELILKPTDYKPGDYLADMTNSMMKASEKGSDGKVIGAAGLWGFSLAKPEGQSEKAGVEVKEVFANTPTAAAGLKAKDRILTIDGRWTDTIGDCYLATSLVKPGRTVSVVVERDGKELTLKVTPTKGY
jgi:hypothetical protein